MWAHRDVDLAPHPVVGLVLQAGDANKFPWAFGFRRSGSFSQIRKQGPCFTDIEENRGDKRLVQLELACEADGVASPDPV